LNADLSLEQAPPIQVPFRFFISAPLFGIAASILLLAYAPTIFVSRWSPETLALTHLVTLGFMGLIMCGAMLQMLPVLSGITVPRVTPLGTSIHILLVTGIITFTTGLLISSSNLLTITIVFLGTGFGIFIMALLAAMLRNKMANTTIGAMRLAVISLLITAAFGISLLGTFIWPGISINPVLFTDIHATWGILGWVALLLVGVAYQVVPMFQMTREYPQWMTRFLLPTMFGGLITWTVIKLTMGTNGAQIASLVMLVCITGYAGFAITTLWLQQNRKRRIPDTTLLFWQFAMLSTLAAALLWLIYTLMPEMIYADRYPLVLGIILLAGFAVSVMNGMLYKIMPFLIWFHLQHRQLSLGLGRKYAIPNMKQIIPARHALWQFYLHVVAVMTLILAGVHPTVWLIYPAGVAMTMAFALLSYNQFRAIQLYRDYDLRLKAASTALVS